MPLIRWRLRRILKVVLTASASLLLLGCIHVVRDKVKEMKCSHADSIKILENLVLFLFILKTASMQGSNFSKINAVDNILWMNHYYSLFQLAQAFSKINQKMFYLCVFPFQSIITTINGV